MGTKELKMSRIASKGQVTIPRQFREKLNLKEGDRVLFEEKDGEVVVRKAAVVALNDFFDVVDKSGAFENLSEEEALKLLKEIRRERNDK